MEPQIKTKWVIEHIERGLLVSMETTWTDDIGQAQLWYSKENALKAAEIIGDHVRVREVTITTALVPLPEGSAQ